MRETETGRKTDRHDRDRDMETDRQTYDRDRDREKDRQT